jgi:hypothetical protein
MYAELVRREQRVRLLGDESDGYEFVHVERKVALDLRQDHEYRPACQKQSIAVGWGRRGGARGNKPASAGLVDDDGLLAPCLRQRLSNQSRHHVE